VEVVRTAGEAEKAGLRFGLRVWPCGSDPCSCTPPCG